MSIPPTTVQEFSHAGLDPRVRCFRAGEEVDTFVIFTQRLVVYLDTMSTPELMRQVVELTRAGWQGRPVVVINTHADWDHVYGNAVFTSLTAADGAPPAVIIASEATAARLRSPEARERLASQRAADARFASVTLEAPHVTFTESLTLDGGDLTLWLFPTPGHRADHVSVWIPELRALLAGDAAECPLPCLGTDSDLDAMRASLRRMAELQPAVVLPCHGGTSSPDLTQRNLAYLDRLAGLLGGDSADDAAGLDTEGLDYAATLAWLGTTPDDVPAFYRDFHQEAIEATRRWLAEPS